MDVDQENPSLVFAPYKMFDSQRRGSNTAVIVSHYNQPIIGRRSAVPFEYVRKFHDGRV